MILMQMANALFGCCYLAKLESLAHLLAQVLDSELALHSVAKYGSVDPGGVDVPLLVCRGGDDTIIDPNAHALWQPWLKSGDRLWTCPRGRHFFHCTHASETSSIILDFWQQTVAIGDGSPLIEIMT
jgi:pimeloyl-ACP methyl ester carboxylesterase